MAQPKVENRNGANTHVSVGAIIKREGKYLLMERNKEPLGFAAPAGHVDEGETPEAAIAREVLEEVGLAVSHAELLFHEFVDWNWCSYNVTGHDWFVYACTTEGEVVADRHEAKSYAWHSPEEIRNLTLEPVWEYWFKKMNII